MKGEDDVVVISVGEKAAHPVDEKWGDVEVMEVPDHLSALNSVQSSNSIFCLFVCIVSDYMFLLDRKHVPVFNNIL